MRASAGKNGHWLIPAPVFGGRCDDNVQTFSHCLALIACILKHHVLCFPAACICAGICSLDSSRQARIGDATVLSNCYLQVWSEEADAQKADMLAQQAQVGQGWEGAPCPASCPSQPLPIFQAGARSFLVLLSMVSASPPLARALLMPCAHFLPSPPFCTSSKP